MANQIKLPNLGENIESGDVLSILVSEGDTVKKNQDLLEIETDKATMPVPSPSAGKITKILVAEGDTVKIGAAIMEIEAAVGDSPAPPAKPAEVKASPPKSAIPVVEHKEAAEEVPQATAVVETRSVTARETAPPKATPAVDGDDDVPGDGHSSSAAGPAVRRPAGELGGGPRPGRAGGRGGGPVGWAPAAGGGGGGGGGVPPRPKPPGPSSARPTSTSPRAPRAG